MRKYLQRILRESVQEVVDEVKQELDMEYGNSPALSCAACEDPVRDPLRARMATEPTYSIEDDNIANLFEDLGEQELDALGGGASQVVGIPAFKTIITRLINQQINLSARSQHSERNADLALGNISGMYMVRDKFEQMASDYVASKQPAEQFDDREIT
jgi:hypothetical protein